MQLTQSFILGSVQFREPVPAASCTMQLTQSCILIENVKEGEGRRGGVSERGGLERIVEDFSKFLCLSLFCVPNHSSFMSSDNKADSNVKGWFDAHCLKWSDAIAKTLDDQGVEFVEDLKILNRAVFSHLFMEKKPIVKTRAEIAWKELGGREMFQFQKVGS